MLAWIVVPASVKRWSATSRTCASGFESLSRPRESNRSMA